MVSVDTNDVTFKTITSMALIFELICEYVTCSRSGGLTPSFSSSFSRFTRGLSLFRRFEVLVFVIPSLAVTATADARQLARLASMSTTGQKTFLKT